ncbi:MAG: DUF4160 domain-containing protein [Ignavibacteriae bacterium]|nr:DUF4160 domain-containing protein [Ignavibacteriota bacterium]
MPLISRFYGISIYIHFRDHQPPHFHAIYGEYEAMISIQDGKLLQGEMPERAMKLIREWSDEHRQELLSNWKDILNKKPYTKVDPLQ